MNDKANQIKALRQELKSLTEKIHATLGLDTATTNWDGKVAELQLALQLCNHLNESTHLLHAFWTLNK